MSKKRSRGRDAISKEDSEFLDSMIEVNKHNVELNTNRAVFYFFVALFTTLLPSYLFQGVKDLEFEGLAIVLFLIMSIASAVLLSIAYHNVFVRQHMRLKKENDRLFKNRVPGASKWNAEERRRAELTRDKMTDLGAQAYSFMLTNFVYLALVLFFSFYALVNADVRINYTISLIASSYICYWLSSVKTKNTQA